MTAELVPGRLYKLKGIRQWVKVIRNVVRPETGEAYVEIWESKYGHTWSGQALVPLTDLMTDTSKADR